MVSLETDEYLLLTPVEQAHEATALSQFWTNQNPDVDKLNALRLQLIQKNRLLADLRRQLQAAQNTLTQLYCMADSNVTATLQIHQQVTDTPISLLDCAVSAMQELDSCSDRMFYLVKQLQNNRLSTHLS